MLVGRLAPIPDSLRFGQSNGAKLLEALRARAWRLDHPQRGRELPPDYDRQCFDTAMRLREQGGVPHSSGGAVMSLIARLHRDAVRYPLGWFALQMAFVVVNFLLTLVLLFQILLGAL